MNATRASIRDFLRRESQGELLYDPQTDQYGFPSPNGTRWIARTALFLKDEQLAEYRDQIGHHHPKR